MTVDLELISQERDKRDYHVVAKVTSRHFGQTLSAAQAVLLVFGILEGMKTTLHSIHTEDGLLLHGVLYRPEKETQRVLVHVHGMAGNFYENLFLGFLAKTLTDNGIAFCAFNNRGNGHITDFVRVKNGKKDFVTHGSSGERFEDCLLDIQAYVNFVKGEGLTKVHVSGHSLGAPKVIYYAFKTGEDLQSIILLSPPDMLGLVRNDQHQFEKEITTANNMVQNGDGEKLLPEYVWGEYPIKAKTYLDLFGDDSKTAIFNFLNQGLGFEVLSKIDKPILSVMGRKDDVAIIPVEEIMELLEKEAVLSPKSETKILGNADHIYQGHEQELANVLNDWIAKI